jgi:hypothetical protein
LDRATLVKNLSRLTPSDFAMLISCLDGADRQISRYVTIPEQAAELVRWGGSRTGPGLDKLGVQYRRLLATDGAADGKQRPHKIVPKGLKFFDAEDKDFFLELLPGPRRGYDLPESVHFWKIRIEETDPEKTFRVGYIFGPSGCGKSSLVRAGLLPRLSNQVRIIFVEATGEETEARLLRGFRKLNPATPADADLRSALVEARESILHGAEKILLIIDQFEQWFHEMSTATGTEMAIALRQCDGARIQAILMVRDDYAMDLHQFMEDLGVTENRAENFAVVPKFDLQHARKVLVGFGRGYGNLRDEPEEMTPDQEEFVERAIGEMAEQGRVAPVRLALFAQMLEGKPWNSVTLEQVGGTEGLGVTFLEETFSSRSAPPPYRTHERAAEAVLKALIPEGGPGIKGGMRSHAELLELSGYASRPDRFEDLLDVLDTKLRLISPTKPAPTEGKGEPEGSPQARYFLLTHDYLVPSIREWVARRKKGTRTGRAELLLEDRSSLWNARPENRYLPSLREAIAIGLYTRPRTWTLPQRRMMRQAILVKAGRTLFALVLAGAFTTLGVGLYPWDRASVLIDGLMKAEANDVAPIIEQLADYRYWADRRLNSLLQGESIKVQDRLRASLALLPSGSADIMFLEERLHHANPADTEVILAVWAKHGRIPIARLGEQLEGHESGFADLGIAALLASNVGRIPWRPEWNRPIAAALVGCDLADTVAWATLLKPAREYLIEELSRIYSDGETSSSSRRLQAAVVMATLGGLPKPRLKNLLLSSTEYQFPFMVDMIQREEIDIEQTLRDVLDEEVPPRPDNAYKPTEVTLLLIREWNASYRRRQNAAAVLCILGKTAFDINDVVCFQNFEGILNQIADEQSKVVFMLSVAACYDGPIRTKAWANTLPGMLSNQLLLSVIKPALERVEQKETSSRMKEVVYWLQYLLREQGMPLG